MIWSGRSLVAIVLLAFAVPPIRAQVATGAPPFGSFGGGPDVIDLANLNSHISIPVLHRSGRGGFNFTYDLSYDSSVWYPATSGGVTSWQPIYNWGWRAQTEVAMGYVSHNASVLRTCKDRIGQITGYLIETNSWEYHDAFGASHAFNGFTEYVSGTCGTSTGPGSFNSTSPDGSGYKISVTDSVYTLYDSAGRNINAPSGTGTGAGSVTDRNGNQIGVTTSGVFTDTLGTTALTVTGTAPSNTTFTYTAPSAAFAKYTMSYLSYTVKTNFGCSIAEYGPTSNSLVDRITLPDGSFYQFHYEATPGFGGDVTGRLASVTLPTGGTITYTYTGGNNGIVCADGSAAGLTRATPDGTWTYARAIGTGAASTTTVTDPSSQANQTVIQFQGIYETQRQVYQGSASSGTLLWENTTCYNGNTSNCPTTAVTLPVTQRRTNPQFGSTEIQAFHTSLYDSFGNLTEQDDYDYANGIPATILQKTLITYASLGNINAFRQTIIRAGWHGAHYRADKQQFRRNRAHRYQWRPATCRRFRLSRQPHQR